MTVKRRWWILILGYKKSGNGSEWGIDGFEEFLELKAIMGHNKLKQTYQKD
tara:strand:+ start:88 stop:240 length:153 start_codon:yes stop_codon:yes gene_type:complete